MRFERFRITPNSWALDTCSGLFWRGKRLLTLLPRSADLFGVGLLALAQISYLLARRLVHR